MGPNGQWESPRTWLLDPGVAEEESLGRETVQNGWSLAAENARDQVWLSPAGEKRLRTRLRAAPTSSAAPELAQGAQRARPGPAPAGAAGPASAALVRTRSLSRSGPLAGTRQEKPFVS